MQKSPLQKLFRSLRSHWSRVKPASLNKAPVVGRGTLARFKGKSSWRRRLPQLTALCLGSIAICASLDFSPVSLSERSGLVTKSMSALSYFERYAYSVRMIIYGEQRTDLVEKARQKIVIVKISDNTLRYFAESPLPRELHARVTRELTQAGAKVIAFDLLFDVPRQDNPQGDRDFAGAARQSQRVLWAAVTDNANSQPVLRHAIPLFVNASPFEGHINAGNLSVKQLEQSVVDSLQAIVPDKGKFVPAFSLMAARMAVETTRKTTNKAMDVVPATQSSKNRLSPFAVPLDERGNFKITFLGGAGNSNENVFPEISYEAIYRGEAQSEFYKSHNFFRDKIVLIGDDTTFGKDYRYTPIGEMSGVEIHAHAISTLLLGCFIREVPTWVNLGLIALMGAVVCPLAAVRKLQWIVLGVLSILSLYFVLNIWLFVFHGWWLHLVAPCAALVLSTVFMLVERGFFEEGEKEHMFDALVSAAGSAIERRDPSTSGHSQRVTALTIALAEAVSEQRKGPFKNVRFSASQIKELRYAGLLHDFGKIGVRENVLTKSHKLDPRHFEAVVGRLLVARNAVALDYSQRQLNALQNSQGMSLNTLEILQQELAAKLVQIDEDIALLEKSNDPMVTFLPDAQYEQLHALLDRLESMSFRNASGVQTPVITSEERNALSIRKGSLTPDEYREVQKHAALSFDFLEQIPWTDGLSNIPEIARAHHEKLNGKGYPQGLTESQIPLQARMMTIADIFDALTAADRPYKKAMPVDKALQILRSEAEDGALDMDLLDIFIEQRVHSVTEHWNYSSPNAGMASGAQAYAL